MSKAISRPDAFSPGPWHFQWAADLLTADLCNASGRSIVEGLVFVDEIEDRNRANARLLAASRDLYDAALLAGPAIESLMDEVVGRKATDWAKVNGALLALQTAIVRADGERSR